MISGTPSPLMSAVIGDDERFQPAVWLVQAGVGSAACALDAGNANVSNNAAAGNHRARIDTPIPVRPWSAHGIDICRHDMKGQLDSPQWQRRHGIAGGSWASPRPCADYAPVSHALSHM